MRDKLALVVLAVFAVIGVGLLFMNMVLGPRDFWRSARLDAQSSGSTTSTTPEAMCSPITVVIARHDGCLRIAKGTPHLSPGTPLELIVEEDRR